MIVHTRKLAGHVAILVLSLGAPATAYSDESHLIVSLVHLITRPSDYQGKIVTVQGYLSEGMRLYLTEDHARIADSPSSVAIEALPELMRCSEAYVHLSGRFDLRKDEYGIVKVLEVSRWVDPQNRTLDKAPLSTCWKQEAEE